MTVRPVNIEAEQALIGAMLINNEIADHLSGLDPEHFHDPVHGRIYGLIMRRIAEGRRADAVALRMLLADDEGLAELGGTDYLARLAGAAISIIAAPDYARDIMDLARRRRHMAALDEAIAALPTAEDPDDVLAALESALSADDGPTDQRRSGTTLSGAMEAALNGMNEAYHGRAPTGISLCIPVLEEVIGKARPGDYILLAGRPSMGKSAIASEIARRAAHKGTAVVYWCHEMAPEDNAERMLSAALRENGIRLPYRDARAGDMSEGQFRSMIETAHDMRTAPITFIEPAIRKMDRLCHEIRRHARRYQRAGHDVLVVVDYLQQIDPGGRSRYESVTEASMAMKALAMELRAPILVLAQLSRGVEQRENKRPMLSDLRDSGQIEQDANTVLLLYRDEYYLERALEADPDSPDAPAIEVALSKVRGALDILVAKQRSGPIKTVRLGFEGATNTLYDFGHVVPFPARDEGFSR